MKAATLIPSNCKYVNMCDRVPDPSFVGYIPGENTGPRRRTMATLLIIIWRGF